MNLPGPPDEMKKGAQKFSYFDLIEKKLCTKYRFSNLFQNIDAKVIYPLFMKRASLNIKGKDYLSMSHRKFFLKNKPPESEGRK